MPTSGYSGTPLAQKLGIRPGARLYLDAAPENYAQLVAPLPPGVRTVQRIDAATDLVHLFATARAALEKRLHTIRRAMRDDATIWVSWPKKASRVPTDLSENVVRELALPLGLVDIKVCAVDDTWSGLKLVVRKGERAGARPGPPRQPGPPHRSRLPRS
jgi:hypothetical protein